MPAKPRWLLAIPDAISQLEQLDRTLLTRRDIERLFGVGRVRAATLMTTLGAEFVGNHKTLPRTRLLQQLKKHRGRAAFRGEEERGADLELFTVSGDITISTGEDGAATGEVVPRSLLGLPTPPEPPM